MDRGAWSKDVLTEKSHLWEIFTFSFANADQFSIGMEEIKQTKRLTILANFTIGWFFLIDNQKDTYTKKINSLPTQGIPNQYTDVWLQ